MKRSVWTATIHFLFGLITIFATIVLPIAGVMLFAIFTIYELDEDWRIKDGAWIDIRQYAVGMVVAIFIYYLLG